MAVRARVGLADDSNGRKAQRQRLSTAALPRVSGYKSRLGGFELAHIETRSKDRGWYLITSSGTVARFEGTCEEGE